VKEGTGSWNIYYICRDYLGSITCVTNSSGSVVQELSYDAWGQLRNPTNQTVYAPDAAPELFLGRGYTGHEHLPMFGLVNMNARLYDPAVGRFLSPDPYVQMPDFSQSFNRYSYALNNPLCYIDRNGEFFWIPILVAAVVGAYTGGAIANHSANPLTWDFGSGKTWGYMGIGALIGGAGAVAVCVAGPTLGGLMCGAFGIGTGGAAGGSVMGLVGGMVGGFVTGAGFTALNGGDFQDIMAGGLKGAAIGGGTGAAVGGVFGGVKAFLDGKNVWTGETIADGRSAFSFNNTPAKGSALKAFGNMPDPNVPNSLSSNQTTNYNDLVKEAQKLYPNKADVTEMHHITPQYLGGAKDGPLVPLNGSYHQVITNEFRNIYPYGLPKPDISNVLDITKQVYSKYPLPPGY
ncbi:MAG: hypothetical protein FWF53_00005, partial [Candidatus Azobacteroides sp.]|nr:hypothetical protein [Candidatus Azobacteroides sp.]